ncbi:MAG: SlyX family protein [Alphaproteobacteria bacterium]|nr:SlyX family protein [Alphaproteobacteria bacterium]
MSQDPTAQIEQLEMTLAHQDQTLEDLNAVILAQREELDRLTRRVNKLMSRVDMLEDAAPAPEAKKPPHW